MRKTSKSRTVQNKIDEDQADCIGNAIADLDLYCRAIVGLTGMAVGFGIAIGSFLVCGAVVRLANEVREVFD